MNEPKHLLRRLTAIVLAVGVLALTAGLPGCNIGMNVEKEQRTLTAIAGAASPVSVTTRNGSVSIRVLPGATAATIRAEVRATTVERLRQITVTAAQDASWTLVIGVTAPPDGWKSNEGCSLDITLPGASATTVTTDNGAIDVSGMSGAALLRTSNGAVRVMNQAGAVDARTSNGAITLTNVNSPVVADTSNGSVSIALADSATGPVSAHSSNGGISLRVGGAFVGRVNVSTSNGSIDLPTGSRVKESRAERGSGTVVFGGDAPLSTLDTSNGSVEVLSN